MKGMTMEPLAYDVIVVGAGMAGLTAAAYISRAGFKVLLCEKEKKTGGLVNSFEYKGYVFDGGIRAIENSGIVHPMLAQLGLQVDFLPNPVSIGIGNDVIRVDARNSLAAYQDLLEKHFPDNRQDIASIIREVDSIMTAMDVLYSIDNPLFLDLKNNPQYMFRTILPWALKYALTVPRINRVAKPVDEYLARFTGNQALIDIIGQHFFQKVPASFALGYFNLYLDYRYPKGGTGALAHALEQYVLANRGEIRRETEITRLDAGRRQIADSQGNVYTYKKLVWAADQKMLYRVADLASVADSKVISDIEARKKLLVGKSGGDSVFTVYLTVDLDKEYFAQRYSTHFFYTPSTAGLSCVKLDELRDADPQAPTRFTTDASRIAGWLRRYLELTTYEISCPVLRDSTLAPDGKTGLIVSTLFDYSLMKHIETQGRSEDLRRLMAEHVVGVLDASIYPGLKAAVSDSFTATPLTIERISGNSDGAITGWAFTNDVMPAVRSLPGIATAVMTPIPDTYQAGQWTYSPSGLPISILTGKLAADRVHSDLA